MNIYQDHYSDTADGVHPAGTLCRPRLLMSLASYSPQPYPSPYSIYVFLFHSQRFTALEEYETTLNPALGDSESRCGRRRYFQYLCHDSQRSAQMACTLIARPLILARAERTRCGCRTEICRKRLDSETWFQPFANSRKMRRVAAKASKTKRAEDMTHKHEQCSN